LYRIYLLSNYPLATGTGPDIETALEHAAKLGITGIHTTAGLEELEIYRQLQGEGKLTLRVYAWLWLDNIDEYIDKGIKTGQGDEMVRVSLLKGFIDGTIGVQLGLDV
jgi:predicted amidohydrolase YtcJ